MKTVPQQEEDELFPVDLYSTLSVEIRDALNKMG
jgi:hypothetical protein